MVACLYLFVFLASLSDPAFQIVLSSQPRRIGRAEILSGEVINTLAEFPTYFEQSVSVKLF